MTARADAHRRARFATAWLNLLHQVRLTSANAKSVDICELRPDWNWTCDGCGTPISYVEPYLVLIHAVVGVCCMHTRCGEDPDLVIAAIKSREDSRER